MCNVCEARRILDGTYSNRGYYTADWGEGRILEVRASAGGVEFQPGEYQVRRPGEAWPKRWIPTSDLAGTAGWWGFDVTWRNVRSEVRLYVEKKGPKPHEPKPSRSPMGE